MTALFRAAVALRIVFALLIWWHLRTDASHL
jgi:hypothetical protein